GAESSRTCERSGSSRRFTRSMIRSRGDGVKNLTLSYMNRQTQSEWPGWSAFARFFGVRRLWLCAIGLAIGASASASPQSNPAFLGIVMASLPCPTGSTCPGVVVANITPGTPAARAGFRVNDVIQRIDGANVQNPNEAIQMITAKHPGDSIDIEVRRG